MTCSCTTRELVALERLGGVERGGALNESFNAAVEYRHWKAEGTELTH